MEAKEVLDLIVGCIDMPKLKKVVAFSILVPMLEKFVKDSANPYDDKAVEFFKQWAEKNL